MSRGTLKGLLLALVVLLGLCAVCSTVAGVGLWWSTRPPGQVQLQVTYPPSAQVGQPADIHIQVQNLANRPRRIDSVDLDWSWAQHFSVQEVQPQPRDQMDAAPLDFVSFFFDAPLPPGGAQTIRLTLVPLRPGTFDLSIDVCIDGPTHCATAAFPLVVAP